MQRIYPITAILALGSLALTFATSGHAQNLRAGEQLSAQQIEQLGQLPSYATTTSRYRVLPAPASEQKSNPASTLVLTQQGMVATSHHTVQISDVPEAQVRQAVAQGPQPATVTYLAPTGIALVQYASFAQAVDGFNALQAQLPRTSVRLPLSLGKPVAQ